MASHVYDDIHTFLDLENTFTSSAYDDVTIVVTDDIDISAQLQPHANIKSMLLTSVVPEPALTQTTPPDKFRHQF